MTQYWAPATRRPVLPFLLLLFIGIPAGYGDDKPSSPADSDADSPAQSIQVDGTFEAVRQNEISPSNEHLTELKIQRIVPNGTRVTKKQSLVWFETKTLDDKIRNAETDLSLARLDLESDEFAHEQFLKQQTRDKANAIRARDLAQQEYDNYQQVDRERTIKQAEFSLASSEFSLESATEEFQQLEQMYKEDDLTEESEEIVLRRAKRAMESAAFSLQRAKTQTERTIQQSVPRDDANEEDALTRANIDYDKALHAIAIGKRKRDLELQRKRVKLKEQSKKSEEMRAERKKVVLKSEVDGIFIYGQIVRGKLPAKPVELKPGSSVSGKQVIGTVIDPSKLQVRVDLPEEQFHLVRAGVTCKVAPKGMPGVELIGVVKRVSIVPIAAGKYDCVVNVRGKELADVLPAMTCELLFAPAQDGQAK